MAQVVINLLALEQDLMGLQYEVPTKSFLHPIEPPRTLPEFVRCSRCRGKPEAIGIAVLWDQCTILVDLTSHLILVPFDLNVVVRHLVFLQLGLVEVAEKSGSRNGFVKSVKLIASSDDHSRQPNQVIIPTSIGIHGSFVTGIEVLQPPGNEEGRLKTTWALRFVLLYVRVCPTRRSGIFRL
jgi:hypothetical protein